MQNPTGAGRMQWKMFEGALESVKKAGYIQTKQGFGSCQLHVEWASPAQAEGKGQGRGNSGVLLMSQYEVQVLNSHSSWQPGYTWPGFGAGAQASTITGQMGAHL